MGTTPATPNHMIPPNTFINYDNDNKVVNKNEEEENEEEEEDEPVVVDLDGEELQKKVYQCDVYLRVEEQVDGKVNVV